jgi:thiaminase/transcriptional activator TenA
MTTKSCFSDWLREQNRGPWDRMIGHRFCRDMGDDSIPDPVLVRYLRYEHLFVRTAVNVFAYALAKSPSPSDQEYLVGVLRGLTEDQDRYFRDTFQGMGVSGDPIASEALPDLARPLGDGVLKIAREGAYVEILSAMLAAEWMYLTWCGTAASSGRATGPRKAWIDLHVDEPFRHQVAWMKDRVDALGPAADRQSRLRCAEGFGRMLDWEIAFHDAAYVEP